MGVTCIWQLELSKSQADTLLIQLSRHWTNEFESLCQLLAVSAVAHTDETSWSQNSVWAFLSEKSRVLIFGCRKDARTLAQILPKDSFAGIVVNDDAAIYQGFSLSQKCWAHLLRKAIRFTLLEPYNKEYDSFLKGLRSVCRKACKASIDQRLKDAGRTVRVAELVDELSELFTPGQYIAFCQTYKGHLSHVSDRQCADNKCPRGGVLET